MSSSKRIPISEQHWEELGDIKGAGQSWDDVVGDLIEQYKKARLFREVREARENDEFSSLDDVIPPEDTAASEDT
jgi:predicted CopG family antitoxin